jgi:cell division septal protein FtsQ
MWSKRKLKNRRLGRDSVLDVRLRSSQVRAARARMAAIALGVVFATVFGVFLSWRVGEWALNRLVYENKAFAIETIDIQTDGIIAVAQLRRWANVRPGQNLLALDLARVRRDLELVSLVRSVSVERILPHAMRIRVTEREPLAQILIPRRGANGGLEQGVYQLDEDGFVMLPLDPRSHATAEAQPPESLPIVSVPNSLDVQPGRTNESLQVKAAIQFLLAFERSPMAGFVDIKRIDTSAPEVLTVTTAEGSEVTFGLSGFDQALRRWQKIFEWGQKQSRAIATLDLAVSNSIPARWLEASAAPQLTPKSPRTARKKHV